MPRRAVLTEGQRDALLALPDTELELVRHWTLSADDLRVIVSRRRPHNRPGFAVQLCALRYPGRLLRAGELIGQAPLAFVAVSPYRRVERREEAALKRDQSADESLINRRRSGARGTPAR